MFSMNKYITAHLLEKMDNSAYVHEDIDSGKKDEDVSSVGLRWRIRVDVLNHI